MNISIYILINTIIILVNNITNLIINIRIKIARLSINTRSENNTVRTINSIIINMNIPLVSKITFNILSKFRETYNTNINLEEILEDTYHYFYYQENSIYYHPYY